MKKFYKQLSIGILLAVLLIGGCFLFFFSQPSTPPLVAVAQWNRPGDAPIHKGILEGLKQKGYAAVEIIAEDAQGSMDAAIAISKKFERLKPKVIISIGTPISQVLLPMIISNRIPLIFTAVTDPNKVKILPNSSHLVAGLSNFMPFKPQLEFFKKLFPQMKKIGFIYNKNEDNSIAYLNHIEQTLETKPFESLDLIKAPLTSTKEAEAIVKSLAGQVDVIYISDDNMATAASAKISKIALQYNLPVLANDFFPVENGALAALTYDEFQMGVKTGHLAAQVLNGRVPSDLPILSNTEVSSAINMEIAKKLSVDIPKDIQKESHLVYD